MSLQQYSANAAAIMKITTTEKFVYSASAAAVKQATSKAPAQPHPLGLGSGIGLPSVMNLMTCFRLRKRDFVFDNKIPFFA